MRELSLNVLDIVQNSIVAAATCIEIALAEDTCAETLRIEVTDNGRGMDEDTLRQAQSPFYTTRITRSIGLGIPLFKMTCEMTGGSFGMWSEPGKGTKLQAVCKIGHIDMPPVGAMAETIVLLVSCNPAIDFIYSRSRDENSFTLDTRAMRAELEDVALSNPAVIAWLKEYLAEQEALL